MKIKNEFNAMLRETHFTQGFHFARGVSAFLAIIFLCILILGAIRNICELGMDDTDRSPWNRSGMTIHTDAKTGVQYLSIGGSTLTPRLNQDGKPITISQDHENHHR